MESEIYYPFSYRDAVEILKLVQDSTHCQSLDLSVGEMRLSLTRAVPSNMPIAATRSFEPRESVGNAVTPTLPSAPTPESPPMEGVCEVLTPTLGVFYRSPSPGATPFVKEGDVVNSEDQIGLLEVMKLYMPVTAGVSGRITQILVLDGALVEHGQALMLIETD